MLVRYTVKGSFIERQYRLAQEYGEPEFDTNARKSLISLISEIRLPLQK